MVEERIRSFARLPEGWHYGEGRPGDPIAIEHAVQLNREAMKLNYETDAFPGSDGEVQLNVYAGEYVFGAVYEPDGSATYFLEFGGEDIEYEENLMCSDILEKLRDLPRREEEEFEWRKV